MVWFPLGLALAWLLGTFGVFWLTGPASYVENARQLTTFVLVATAIFAGGYALRVWRRPFVPADPTSTPGDIRMVRRLVTASALYYVVWNLVKLDAFGATGPTSVWRNVLDPAAGYLNKLDVYQHAASSSPWLAPLLPFGVLSTALVPLLVIHWRHLFGLPRLIGVVGVVLHVAFYLFIGTMKGLGDLAIMLAAAALILMSSVRRRRRASPRRRALVTIAAVFAIMTIFMVNTQGSRASEFGTSGGLLQAQAHPRLEAAVGKFAANGLASVVAYPTHGYLGLSFNLRAPYSWSHGLGSAPALGLFAKSYGADPGSTYPERTEQLTWWPAQQYWATIYPWLASDLTFPGAALFMGLIGWLFASSWHGAVCSRRVVPTLIFAQLCLLILYVPANNQLGMTMESVIGVGTLLVLHTLRPIVGPRRSGVNRIR